MARFRSRMTYVLLGALMTAVLTVLLNTATAQQEPEGPVGRFQLAPVSFVYTHYQTGADTLLGIVRLDTKTGAMLWIKDPTRNYDGSVYFEAYDVLVRMNPITGLERRNREQYQTR